MRRFSPALLDASNGAVEAVGADDAHGRDVIDRPKAASRQVALVLDGAVAADGWEICGKSISTGQFHIRDASRHGKRGAPWTIVGCGQYAGCVEGDRW